jgi:hypothetical protein
MHLVTIDSDQPLRRLERTSSCVRRISEGTELPETSGASALLQGEAVQGIWFHELLANGDRKDGRIIDSEVSEHGRIVGRSKWEERCIVEGCGRKFTKL